jgi:hypothetical protein
MLKEMKVFMRGVNAMPLPWRGWLMVLVAANLVVPLFFIARPEALATIAAFFASMVLMLWLIRVQGYTRLLGLGHIFWIPLIYYLVSNFDRVPPVDAFGLWMRAVAIMNILSLIVDSVDVARYLAGERASLIPVSNRE